jgi:hypothetical protein
MRNSELYRVDLCHAGDADTLARLADVVHDLGGVIDGGELGVGLNRILVAGGELTVYQDAWGADLAGPEPLVRRVLAAMAGL